MSDSFFAYIVKELKDLGEDLNEIKGCTTQQIDIIRNKQKVLVLPHLYHEFLMMMGVKAAGLFVGTYMFYGDLSTLDLKEEARLLLKKHKLRFRLPKDAFVFLLHQGYIFMYFRTDQVEADPPLYRYIEGDEAPKNIGRMSEFFLEEIELMKEVKKRREARESLH